MQTNHPAVNHQLSNWLAIKSFQAKHPEFSLEQLRWLIRTNPNNFVHVYTKVGKRIYFNEQRFATWLAHKADGGTK